METIFLVEADHSVKSQLFYLLSSYLHHSLRDVCSDEFVGMQHPGGKDGEVAGAGGDVEHFLWREGRKSLDSLLAPSLVDIPRESVVQGVVGRGDVVKHLLYQLTLISCALVGLNLFLLIHY